METRTPESAAKELGYELGGEYHDGYWKETHKIVAAGWTDTPWPWIRSLWSDGHTTTHCTRFDPKKDRQIS